jgi:hypothetical protein
MTKLKSKEKKGLDLSKAHSVYIAEDRYQAKTYQNASKMASIIHDLYQEFRTDHKHADGEKYKEAYPFFLEVLNSYNYDPFEEC